MWSFKFSQILLRKKEKTGKTGMGELYSFLCLISMFCAPLFPLKLSLCGDNCKWKENRIQQRQLAGEENPRRSGWNIVWLTTYLVKNLNK